MLESINKSSLSSDIAPASLEADHLHGEERDSKGNVFAGGGYDILLQELS